MSRVSPADSSTNCMQGTVKEIAYMGDLSVYLVRLPTGRLVRVTIPNTERQAADRISWDEPVWLSWAPVSPDRKSTV